MTPNSEFAEAYHRVEELEHQKYQITKNLDDEMQNVFHTEWKSFHPRTKKMPEIYAIRAKLDKDWMKSIYDGFVARLDQQQANNTSEIEKNRKIQVQLAVDNQIVFEPADQEYTVGSAYAGNWGSQGWGANKYAERSLGYKLDLLTQNGFSARIDCELGAPTNHRYGYSSPWNTYHLVANCEPWMMKALYLVKANLVAEENWEWDHGVNPKVYRGGYSITER